MPEAKKIEIYKGQFGEAVIECYPWNILMEYLGIEEDFDKITIYITKVKGEKENEN
jgi:hypothetical protein